MSVERRHIEVALEQPEHFVSGAVGKIEHEPFAIRRRWCLVVVPANLFRDGGDARARLDPVGDWRDGWNSIAHLANLDVPLAHAIGRQMEDCRRALNEGIEAPIVHTREVAW